LKIAKRMVILALFMNLITVLCADLFQSDVHGPAGDTGPAHSALVDVDEIDSIHAMRNSESHPCSDPCHVGVSHFGHQFVAFRNSSVAPSPNLPEPGEAVQIFSRVDDPDIYSPKRPPKSS